MCEFTVHFKNIESDELASVTVINGAASGSKYECKLINVNQSTRTYFS
jgi:hypothetical protein